MDSSSSRSKMGLKYDLSHEQKSLHAQIVNRCMVEKVKYVYDNLDRKYKKMFEDSCFGHLLGLHEMKCYQIIHQLIIRQLKNVEKDESFWFMIGDKPLRFGVKEFVVVSGLKVGPEKTIVEKDGKLCRLGQKYFNGQGMIDRNHLLNAFDRVRGASRTDKDAASDKYKLGLLVVLSFVLLATEVETSLDWWWFELVEDLDAFNMYPWGNLSYNSTVNIFRRPLKDNFTRKKVNYSLYGLTHAVLAWALESIPSLGKLGRVVDENALPRMKKWEVEMRVTAWSVITKLEAKEVHVIPTIVASDEEKGQLYYVSWLEMEGEDNDHYEFENMDEPPKTSNDCASDYDEVVKVLKEENKNLSSKLEDMKKKLDWMEAISCQKCKRNFNIDMVGVEEVGEPSHGKEGEKEAEQSKGEEKEGEKVAEKVGEASKCQEKEGEEKEQQPVNDKGKEIVDESVGVDDGGNEVVGVGKRKGEKKKVEKKIAKKKRASCEEKVDDVQNAKRKKVDNVSAFDPYGEVDIELIQEVEKFVDEVPDSQNLTVFDETGVYAVSLKSIAQGGWLTTPIMNAAFAGVRGLQKAYPGLFDQDACILDTYFLIKLKGIYSRWIKSPKDGKPGVRSVQFKFEKTFLNYVKGIAPKDGKPWEGCKCLYMPVNEKNHWFLIKVDLEKRMVYVYDSLGKHVRPVELVQWTLPLQVLIPQLLSKHVAGFEKYALKHLRTVKNPCPMQENGSDCGMFTIKFLEFLLAGMDVKLIRNEHVPTWRKKLVGELLKGQFQP